jgi:hypothetical protein
VDAVLNIVTQKVSSTNTARLEILTIEGVKINELRISGNRTELSTASWKTGVYILKFQIDDQQIVKRIIKK